MVVLSVIISILLAFTIVNCQDFSPNSTDGYNLVFAHVINRHGDRNIKNTFPTDQYQEEHFWKNGYAELSNIGKREQYELGRYLRGRYLKLVGPQYKPDKVYLQCSDVNRNLMSLECMGAGMFPPSGDEVWNENLKWQPIPVHTVEFRRDNILSSRVKCPSYSKYEKKCAKDEVIAAKLEEHRGFITSLEVNSGQPLSDAHEISKFYDILAVEDRRGFVLPEWAYKAIKDNETLNYLGSLGYQSQTCSDQMKKLRAGFLIREILDRFKTKITYPERVTEVLWVYGTQATIVVSILNTLGVFDYLIPPFSSTIFFELYEKEDEYFVQVIYRTTISEDAAPVKIPNCGTMCPLSTFYDLYKHIMPKKSEKFQIMCQLPDEEEEFDMYIFTISGLIAVALVIIIIAVSWRKCRNNNKPHTVQA